MDLNQLVGKTGVALIRILRIVGSHLIRRVPTVWRLLCSLIAHASREVVPCILQDPLPAISEPAQPAVPRDDDLGAAPDPPVQ